MFELIYCSVAKPEITMEDISSILNTSRSFNKNNNITGCLLYHEGEFIQLLEGEKNSVQDLFSNIRRDKRHTHVRLVNEEHVVGRAFENWNMAFYDLTSAEYSPIVKTLFIENMMVFSDLANKPTETAKLFWYMANQILNSNWPAES
ncbi:BLUF domain-containing protein [Aurantibacillus circumpalustris]|uniref:BLUF domain-containing protein n=1 Tax=Aurantibacillus circumpalustris TaxID=3036359 RepID=UPI00295BE690|nr:BLUF domain-containing protein [Aurantibacillus circumpalustris]